MEPFNRTTRTPGSEYMYMEKRGSVPCYAGLLISSHTLGGA